MKKNTVDIINRAKELADLQNSDFIGIKENTSLLNEAYTKLYTELINHNDRYYIKTLTVDELELVEVKEKEVIYKLPEDFYMLCNISSGVNCEQVLKKAFSESKTYKRYDIINDNLYLYGGVEQEDLEICYYPTPEYLTLKVPDKSIVLPDGYTWIDCTDNKYFGWKPFDDSYELMDFVLYNLKDGSIKTVNEVYLSIQSGVYSDLFAIVKTLDGVYKVDFYRESVSDITERIENINTCYMGKKDNKVYLLYKKSENEENIYTLYNGIEEEDIELNISELSEIKSFTFDDAMNFYFLSENKIYIVKNNVNVLYSNVLNYLNCFNNKIYYETTEGIFEEDKKLFNKYSDYKDLFAINKIDINTGYGVTVITEDNQTKILSILEDTEIEFPNNFYYQYLSYMLAIAYKSKQNADATMLQEQANNESAQFYNTVNRDASRSIRINNVYSGGWF